MKEPVSTDYEAGLQKLGLCSRVPLGDVSTPPIDLRSDPAFAWRVFVAYQKVSTVTNWVDISQLSRAMQDMDCAEALYVAVEALGR